MRLLTVFLALLCCAMAGEKRAISPETIKPIGHYSPGILTRDFLYVSGQGAKNPQGQIPAAWRSDGSQIWNLDRGQRRFPRRPMASASGVATSPRACAPRSSGIGREYLGRRGEQVGMMQGQICGPGAAHGLAHQVYAVRVDAVMFFHIHQHRKHVVLARAAI